MIGLEFLGSAHGCLAPYSKAEHRAVYGRGESSPVDEEDGEREQTTLSYIFPSVFLFSSWDVAMVTN